MGDVFAGLLPYLPGLPFSIALIVVYRLWLSAIKELRLERKDHAKTDRELDMERDARRKVEDKVDQLTREVAGLRAEVSRLRTQLGEST